MSTFKQFIIKAIIHEFFILKFKFAQSHNSLSLQLKTIKYII